MYVRQDYIFRCEFWGSEIKSVLQNIKIPPTHNFLTGPVTYNELSNELTNLSAEYLFSFLKDLETFIVSKVDRDFNKKPFTQVVDNKISASENRLGYLLENNFNISKGDDDYFINGYTEIPEQDTLRFSHIKSNALEKSYSFKLNVDLNKLTKNKLGVFLNVILSRKIDRGYDDSMLTVRFNNASDRVLEIFITNFDIAN